MIPGVVFSGIVESGDKNPVAWARRSYDAETAKVVAPPSESRAGRQRADRRAAGGEN
jgi:hypothetical protein